MKKCIKMLKSFAFPLVVMALLMLPEIIFAQTGSGTRSGGNTGFSTGINDLPANDGIGYFVGIALIFGIVQLYFKVVKNKTVSKLAA